MNDGQPVFQNVVQRHLHAVDRSAAAGVDLEAGLFAHFSEEQGVIHRYRVRHTRLGALGSHHHDVSERTHDFYKSRQPPGPHPVVVRQKNQPFIHNFSVKATKIKKIITFAPLFSMENGAIPTSCIGPPTDKKHPRRTESRRSGNVGWQC